MDLIKKNWKKNDITEFQNYLKIFENPQKREWSTKILQTNLPVLCLKTQDIKDIVKKIQKGNYLEFLDLMIWEYYENTAINGFLINKINDINIKFKYLNMYSEKADNWATCDLLTFNVKNNEQEYFKLSQNYIKSKKPFVRRIGIYILFNIIDNENYVDSIYEIMDKFKKEEFYYVNMMNSWILCELFIKQKDKTLKYLEQNNLNKFTINKFIQKCRESRRVSKEDKKILLTYKISNMEFKKISEFKEGTLYNQLVDAYSFNKNCKKYWNKDWLEYDKFFYNNLNIVDKYGFISIVNNKVVGHITWDPRNIPKYVIIGYNCILSKYKGKGYGKKQLENAIRIIKEYNVKKIIVTTNEITFAAQKNYESVGFKKIKKRKNNDIPFAGDYIDYELMV